MKSNTLKYSIIILSLISFTISSCKKRDKYTWAEINGGSVEYFAYDKQYSIETYNSTINTDSLIISVNLSFNITYPNDNFNIVDVISPFGSFDVDYNPKLRHSISNIILRSHYDFNNISAGQSLNDKVVVIENPYFNGSIWTYSNEISLQEYGYKNLVQLTNPYSINTQFFIKFKEKPTQSVEQFILDFIDYQGTHFYIEMNKINWI